MIVKELRLKANMTQQELADKIGVQRSTIAMVEIGKNNLSIDLAKKIAEVFGIEWTYFFNN